MLPPLLVLNWPRQEVSQGDDSDGDDDDGDGDDGDCVDEWYFSFLSSDSSKTLGTRHAIPASPA